MLTTHPIMTVADARNIHATNGAYQHVVKATLGHFSYDYVMATATQAQFFDLLSRFPLDAARGLVAALAQGEVSGMTYYTCIGGVLARGALGLSVQEALARDEADWRNRAETGQGVIYAALDARGLWNYASALPVTPLTEVENDAFAIYRGDTSDGNVKAALYADWTEQYIAEVEGQPTVAKAE